VCAREVRTWGCAHSDAARELVRCWDGRSVYTFAHIEVKGIVY
jgi:hypothetical protein